jgi:hypothetical protein
MYFVGSNWVSGGPTIIMSNNDVIVLTEKEDLAGFTIKFI